MIPRTYPSRVNSTTGRVEALVSFISSTTGLQRWVDYTPVAFVTDATPVEGSYDNDGYIAVADVGSTAGLQAGKDYIRVYLDPNATDAWRVNSVGFIPVGYSGIGGIPYALFANNEQGVWYDPSDFDRYMAPLGPELVTNGTFDVDASGWTAVGGATLAVVGSSLEVTSSADGQGASQLIATQAGKTYKVTFSNGGGTASFVSFRISDSTFLTGNLLSIQSSLVLGQNTGFFVATSNSTTVYVRNGSAGTRTWDNISVRELTAIDTATLFQDSAGTTPVTAVEQPVGLMLDKSKGLVLGPELVTNAADREFTSDTGWWTKNGSAVIGGGKCTLTTGSSVQRLNLTTAGKWYVLEYDLTVRSGSLYITGYYSQTNQTTSGRKKFIIYATTGTFKPVVDSGDVDIDNISVRELPGNHAFQTTSTSRPVLSARYNLLTKTEQFDDAVWVKTGQTSSTYQGTGSQAVVTANYGVAPNGEQTADRVQLNLNGGTTNSDRSGFAQLTPGLPAASYTYSLHIKSLTGTSSASVAQALSTNISAVGSAVIVNLPDGWVRATWTSAPAVPPADIRVQITGTSGLNSSDFLIWGADLRVANDAAGQPAYQRVNTATDYDTAGFKPYLRFDGTDDGLQTNSIDFTGTDKMTVFAGVRKLSDAASGTIAELSAILDSNNGSFALFAPRSGTVNAPNFVSRGTLTANPTPTSMAYPAPITNVLTGIGDIAGDVATISANGVQVATASSDQGTGNYGSYPLFIGRRGGTTLPFNGRIYGLIVRGAATTTATIQATETYMNGKTGAY